MGVEKGVHDKLLALSAPCISKAADQLIKLRVYTLDVLLVNSAQGPPSPQELAYFTVK